MASIGMDRDQNSSLSYLARPMAATKFSRIGGGRAHGACEIWVRGAAQREIKARGGGDAGTSLTTSNAEIALGLRTQFRNPHAAGPLADPGPFGFRRRSERGPLYFHHGLLGFA